VIEFRGKRPEIHANAYVSPRATLIGDVSVGESSSIWENAVLRGDMGSIRVGRGSSVQDNCTIHTNILGKCEIGDSVTVGHNAVIHGSTIHDHVIVGMNSTLLEGSEVGPNSIVAAGSVVLEREKTPPGVLLAGVPARVVRNLTDSDLAAIKRGAEAYVEVAKLYRENN
jgi:carbonic anhydrase/acetyltransferase-like protein (isoleucine patch superfamily)